MTPGARWAARWFLPPAAAVLFMAVGYGFLGFLIAAVYVATLPAVRARIHATYLVKSQNWPADSAQVYVNIRRWWPGIVEAAGLTVRRSNGEMEGARLAAVEVTPAGVKVGVGLPAGMDPARVDAGRFGSAIGRPTFVEIAGAQQIWAEVRLRDPAAGRRDLVAGAASAPGMAAPVRLGRRADGNGEIVVDMADAAHWIMQGMTRSGKSVLTYGILAQCHRMPHVRIVGIDPTAILLGAMRDQTLIHTGTADMANAARVLDEIMAEMTRRIAALVEYGMDKLSVFNEEWPLIVVVLEEWPGVLAAAQAEDDANGRRKADAVAPKLQMAVRRLIQESAKVGIRMLMMAQRADASIVGGAERSNFGYRVTLRVDNGDAVRMLHPNATPEVISALEVARPGCGVIAIPGEPLTEFVADFCSYEMYRQIVGQNSPAR